MPSIALTPGHEKIRLPVLASGLLSPLHLRPAQGYFSNIPLLKNSLIRIGIGGALANPFTIVRDQKWFENGGITAPILNESGYHLTVPFMQVGLQKIGPLGLSIETKWVGGWVNVPVVDGNASFWHQSLHFLGGISLR